MPKLISNEIIKRIKFLRQRGYSLPEIKREVKVSQGSVFRHIQGVKVLPQFKHVWFGKWKSSIKRKIESEQRAQFEAEKLVDSLTRKEKILFLSALYWGEGNKKDFMFTNSDPSMIKIFVKGMMELFAVTKKSLKISIRIYEDLDKKKCLDYWAKITGISYEEFQSVGIIKGKKTGRLPFGMCRVRVKKGGYLLKYTQALKERVVNLF